MKTSPFSLPAIILALGIFGASLTIALTLKDIKNMERTVSVRGLSEIECPADHVIWPLVYSIDGDDLISLFSMIERNNAIVLEFLEKGGIPKSEITVGTPDINDRMRYSNNNVATRYQVSQSITVSSAEVEKVRSLISQQTTLLKSNIALMTGEWQYQTQYLFKGLDQVKPKMIEEATQNARSSAQKFADDSQSTLGKIKRASQGQLSIEDRDQNTPHIKKLRVVTTIEYSLSN